MTGLGVGSWVCLREGGGEEVVIDAAPACRAHSVIVINNSGLAIWARTGQFVCPQSSVDKWSQFRWVLCIKQNRCSRGMLRWEATGGNMLFAALYLQQVGVVQRGRRWRNLGHVQHIILSRTASCDDFRLSLIH